MSTIFGGNTQEQTQDVVSVKGQAALEYAKRGWHVFPLQPDGKEPLFRLAPEGQKNATTDEAKIRDWWASAPNANIGVHLAPSNLVVVDEDSYKGEVQPAGELPPTLTQRSARNGTHLFYAAEPDTRYSANRSKNLDVKHRGYVVVAPSTFEGKPYIWANQNIPAKAPEWLKRQSLKADAPKLSEEAEISRAAQAREALQHISPDIPYDRYMAVLMGLHDALGNAAIELAEEWLARSTDPTHAHRHDQLEYKFASFTQGSGATLNTVFHEAQQAGCDLAQLHAKHGPDVLHLFAPAEPEETARSIFETLAEQEKETEAADIFPLVTTAELRNREPPKFLIARHIPQNSLGFVYSAPGVGKSFMAQDIALHIAYKLPDWHGDKIEPSGDGSVIYIASEGSFDLPLRVEAWKAAHNIDHDTDQFLILETSVNFMRQEDVQKLIRTIKAANRQPSLIVVDTVSRALPGADENLQKDMTLFVAACDRIRETFLCAVMGLHHSAKGGGIRGSSVIEGAGDFILQMERDKGAQVGEVMMFKQKAAPDGWSVNFTLKAQNIPNTSTGEGNSASSLVFQRADPETLAAVAEVGRDTKAILDAIEKAWLEGKPWSKEPRAKGRYAVAILGDHFGLPKLEAKALLDKWLKEGVLQNAIQNGHEKRPGLRVSREGSVYQMYDVFG